MTQLKMIMRSFWSEDPGDYGNLIEVRYPENVKIKNAIECAHSVAETLRDVQWYDQDFEIDCFASRAIDFFGEDFISSLRNVDLYIELVRLDEVFKILQLWNKEIQYQYIPYFNFVEDYGVFKD